ncbi:hypothetical protein EUZ85_12010 [Hahella sp. KA22]|uniref:hypothetical protein n=1 Tax=Hahella sp. KA22 TaxID=1628392 RepID=UPI000FDD5264|nr:hypothetical protein [Hahella sp. KA22]AZZ91419.1 hypothetical protein ENC22_09450 [Hahella sp. KA22]QAY54789.1 hypothetical protein EUZ85_12010 [Hahella sp. KA22]
MPWTWGFLRVSFFVWIALSVVLIAMIVSIFSSPLQDILHPEAGKSWIAAIDPRIVAVVLGAILIQILIPAARYYLTLINAQQQALAQMDALVEMLFEDFGLMLSTRKEIDEAVKAIARKLQVSRWRRWLPLGLTRPSEDLNIDSKRALMNGYLQTPFDNYVRHIRSQFEAFRNELPQYQSDASKKHKGLPYQYYLSTSEGLMDSCNLESLPKHLKPAAMQFIAHDKYCIKSCNDLYSDRYMKISIETGDYDRFEKAQVGFIEMECRKVLETAVYLKALIKLARKRWTLFLD